MVKILMLVAGSATIVSIAALAYRRASGLTYGEALYKVCIDHGRCILVPVYSLCAQGGRGGC